jgi:hypothetical protein
MAWRDHAIYMQAADASGGRSIAVMNDDGTCPTSDCPRVLANYPGGGTVGFVLDATDVYADSWEDGRIFRAALDFSAPAATFATAVGPRGLAVDARAVYWGTWEKDGAGDHGSVVLLAK